MILRRTRRLIHRLAVLEPKAVLLAVQADLQAAGVVVTQGMAQVLDGDQVKVVPVDKVQTVDLVPALTAAQVRAVQELAAVAEQALADRTADLVQALTAAQVRAVQELAAGAEQVLADLIVDLVQALMAAQGQVELALVAVAERVQADLIVDLVQALTAAQGQVELALVAAAEQVLADLIVARVPVLTVAQVQVELALVAAAEQVLADLIVDRVPVLMVDQAQALAAPELVARADLAQADRIAVLDQEQGQVELELAVAAARELADLIVDLVQVLTADQALAPAAQELAVKVDQDRADRTAVREPASAAQELVAKVEIVGPAREPTVAQAQDLALAPADLVDRIAAPAAVIRAAPELAVQVDQIVVPDQEQDLVELELEPELVDLADRIVVPDQEQVLAEVAQDRVEPIADLAEQAAKVDLEELELARVLVVQADRIVVLDQELALEELELALVDQADLIVVLDQEQDLVELAPALVVQADLIVVLVEPVVKADLVEPEPAPEQVDQVERIVVLDQEQVQVELEPAPVQEQVDPVVVLLGQALVAVQDRAQEARVVVLDRKALAVLHQHQFRKALHPEMDLKVIAAHLPHHKVRLVHKPAVRNVRARAQQLLQAQRQALKVLRTHKVADHKVPAVLYLPQIHRQHPVHAEAEMVIRKALVRQLLPRKAALLQEAVARNRAALPVVALVLPREAGVQVTHRAVLAAPVVPVVALHKAARAALVDHRVVPEASAVHSLIRAASALRPRRAMSTSNPLSRKTCKMVFGMSPPLQTALNVQSAYLLSCRKADHLSLKFIHAGLKLAG
jgi:hypothetical protein